MCSRFYFLKNKEEIVKLQRENPKYKISTFPRPEVPNNTLKVFLEQKIIWVKVLFCFLLPQADPSLFAATDLGHRRSREISVDYPELLPKRQCLDPYL
jgi:hypothetical protein